MLPIMKNLFRTIKTLVRNIRKYWRVLLSDKDWDYEFLLELLKTKLDSMSDSFRHSGVTISSERSAREMKICSLLIDRILNKDYSEYYNKVAEERYGELEIECHPTERKGFTRVEIFRPKLRSASPAEVKKARKQDERAYLKAEAQKKADLTYLCKIINKKLFNWWD